MRYIKLFEQFSKIDEFKYKFTLDDIEYVVDFYKKSTTSFSIGYGILDKDDIIYSTLNKKNIFKVVNEVVTCIKDFVEKHPKVTHIEFFGMPDNKLDWILKLVGKDVYINWILEKLFDVLSRVIPTKRTNVFQRWAEREGNKMNWSVKKFGNKIIMKKI